MTDFISKPLPSIADIRSEYRQGELDESSVSADPFIQFSTWFSEAQNVNVIESNAMTLATVDSSGQPSARIVLLKGFDARGFVFFTNYLSRKGQDLSANSRAALVFFWPELERQVRVEGVTSRVTREETDLYFHSRPIESQLGAWASEQGKPIDSRAVLVQREKELREKFAGGEIPTPDFWGGYCLSPASVEFWQGRPSRLHDRLLYSRKSLAASDVQWICQRLAP